MTDDSTAATSTSINNTINNYNITNDNNNEDSNPNEHQQVPQPPPCSTREQDRYMPIANVTRIMRRNLPPHAKIADDAKETVQECVSEFIGFVTGEANERCHGELRKTVTAEDVIWAMGKLGFENYVGPLTLFLSRYRQSDRLRTSKNTEPILRPKSEVDYGQHQMPLPYESVYKMGPQQGFYDPSTGGYFSDDLGSGSGSSSQANMPGFDPFAQFK